MTNKFKPGDTVKCLQGDHLLKAGKEYVVYMARKDNILIEGLYEDGTTPTSGVPSYRFDYVFPEVEAKPTNPKEAAGAGRIPLHLIPDGPQAIISMAFYEGATKYGAYNWRASGVRASTYVSALRRHVSKWWNGENVDPKTKVHHLANAAACLIILIDAELQGKLNDDRPPKQDLDKLYNDLKSVQEHLTELHGHLSPVHHTEAKNV